ncbi:nitrogenase cofactor biosynthesis protein NifB [Varunaivibrio sulfuroxidans]|uniref:FeMo cofactor biosynthesis protein NifB n=1 Tax=Varunaivibrio sulfuroxidans TaxID=1773489 RepID=A0A4R3J9U2_9PROT|nr:nitrogenase cofactor biosynthesis protein NifB [Varunaivibrio sulfuroxidans]TCS61733.1 nitrogen fixation protein NifB [Varunaivibrio sulfuroxidans]WES32082.1 nitrogenase cofactor biosynthesis protein NifB [Varunaivibrio sulfuroxidans]
MELPILNREQTPAGGCSKSACGTTTDQMTHLPEAIREKVHNHPCYSEEAHHHYARMHVAVAPACNIQCHYCNRKYDCANESRPGVVSELLSPTQAAKKVLAVASQIPQMTVLGVAGPGDPLANPERTFETFEEIAAKAPDIKLCLSTNGLNLPDNVDRIAALNVDHVTITINCVDPEVGAEIYPWIFWNNRRIRGAKGAKILIRQQQKGLEMLVERGILVKVNSVMIPGVNDAHLKEVSKIVKQKGAFLHNVMPLIAEAEHGTFYGVMGQRSPTASDLQALQDDCSGDMNMMRHCRQCRADAVGLLGEDRGQEFTMDKIEHMEIDFEAAMVKRKQVHDGIEAMRAERKTAQETAQETAPEAILPQGCRPALLAVASKGSGLVNEHFGHAREFLIYEASPAEVRFMGARKVPAYCTGAMECGDGETALDVILDTLSDCEGVISAKVGIDPWAQLEAAGIQPYGEYAMEPIEDAVRAVYGEMIKSGRLESTDAMISQAG